MNVELFPWEVFVLLSFLLALFILYTIIRWVFRPRPKGRFPVKRMVFMLLLLGLIAAPFQLVDQFSDKMRTGFKSTNAFTSDDNPQYPELLTRTYPKTKDELYDTSLIIVRQLGWSIRDQSSSKETLRVHSSHLFLWDDEILISFEPEPNDANQTKIALQSSTIDSTFPDFGSNRRHIQKFYNALDENYGIINTLQSPLE